MKNFKIFICLCAAMFLNSNAVIGQFRFVNESNKFYSATFLLSNLNNKSGSTDNFPANVDRLNLSQDVIFTDCAEEGRCSDK